MVAYTTGHGLYTRGDIAGKLNAESISDRYANMLSQDAQEVEEEGATKKPSPPPLDGKEGEDTTTKPSPRPPSAKEGRIVANEPSSPSTSSSEGGETTDQPPHPPTSWEEILHNRLAFHHGQYDAARDSHAYYRISAPSGMTIDDVLFAVATFWEPLRSQGTHFSLGDTNSCDQSLQHMGSTCQLQGYDVVRKGNVSIMPLLFPPEPEAKKGKANATAETPFSKLGHHLLAVAERESEASKTVNITIYDNRNTTLLDKNVIRRRATELAYA